MSSILADEIIIDKLIGKVISAPDYSDGSIERDKHVNPNGMELRLGNEIRFLTSASNDQKQELKDNQYLVLKPGDSVLVSSYETINFSENVCKELFDGKYLMGLIHPTTTMMREGVAQVATKIDPGFVGVLNWMIRNNSANDIVIKCKEPLYKLSIILLDQDEKPIAFYGESEKHQFQNSEGITDSKRFIPARIPKELRVELPTSSDEFSREKLREQGYPFNHVAQEFQRIDGEFEAVHKRIDRLEDRIKETKEDLAKKIENETNAIAGKIKESGHNFAEKLETKFREWSQDIQQSIMEKVEGLISRSNSKAIAILFAGFAFLASIVELISAFSTNIPEWGLSVIGIAFSLLILIVWAVLFNKKD